MSGDTIFALSTARGRAGIAVIRVSGAAAAVAVAALTGRAPDERGLRLAGFRDPVSGEVLDRGLVLWFPGPASFTGEDVAEFQAHGGTAVIEALLAALAAVPFCRPAEAGEFTRRAFANGKLDLTQVEGLGDLVEAETAAQRRQALAQMGGATAALLAGWRDRIIQLLAHVEAVIDFADEDLPGDPLGETQTGALALAEEIGTKLADRRRGEILRDGLSVALIGPPNSGKSSLMNALAGREAAIVSAHAGTTRDVIEVRLDIGGYPVVLADTAGLRETEDPVEKEGIRRARARAEAADLRLLVLDAGARDPVLLAEAAAAPGAILVWNKSDLARPPALSDRAVAISARTGQGLDALVTLLAAAAGQVFAGPPAVVTRGRHRAALETCRAALLRAAAGEEAALIGEDLRLATRALGRVTGAVDVEDVLDVVFRDFCIGK